MEIEFFLLSTPLLESCPADVHPTTAVFNTSANRKKDGRGTWRGPQDAHLSRHTESIPPTKEVTGSAAATHQWRGPIITMPLATNHSRKDMWPKNCCYILAGKIRNCYIPESDNPGIWQSWSLSNRPSPAWPLSAIWGTEPWWLAQGLTSPN